MELPDWPPGTVAVLSTGAGAPHAIPISTAVRAGRRTLLLALATRREALARLRADPRCAVTVLGTGDVAITALGRANVVQDLPGGVVAVRVDVEEVRDHNQPQFEILDGVRWRWTDARAERRDADVRAALHALATSVERSDAPR